MVMDETKQEIERVEKNCEKGYKCFVISRRGKNWGAKTESKVTIVAKCGWKAQRSK